MKTSLRRTEHYMPRSDGRLYYYTVGEGEPLLFLHNIELSSFIWEKVIDEFAQSFTCYVVDMPGHDRSEIPPQPYLMEDYSQSIVDLMDHAGIDASNIIASHGGGIIAVDLAVRFPQRVLRIIVDGLPYWNLERGKLLWEKFWMPRLTDITSYDIPVKPIENWEEASQANPNLDKEHWENELSIRKRSARWISLSLEAMTKYDIEAMGPRVKAKTFLVYGYGDPLRRTEQRALDGIVNSMHLVIEGVRSGPHWENPGEFAKVSIDFLKS